MADPVQAGSPQAERELWTRYRQSRDVHARDALIELHLPYARTVAAMTFARRYSDEVEFNDYQQFARIGLLEALERYDPDRGAGFRTFAAKRMQGAVFSGLERFTERQQQVAARQRLRHDRTQAAREMAEDAAGGRQTPERLLAYVAEAGIGLALVWLLEGTALIEAPERAEHVPFYQDAHLRQMRTQLLALVEALPAQERAVIRGHYLQEQPFQDIASEMGLTKGRISQIHKQALQRLRGSARSLDVIA